MNDVTTTLGDIRLLIEELNTLAGSNDLARKIEIGEKLATYNWMLAEYEGTLYDKANTAEFDYKSSVNREMARGTGGMQQREVAAKEKHEDLYKVMTATQNILKRISLLRQQTNVVIEQNRQVVAQLKQEWKHQN